MLSSSTRLLVPGIISFVVLIDWVSSSAALMAISVRHPASSSGRILRRITAATAATTTTTTVPATNGSQHRQYASTTVGMMRYSQASMKSNSQPVSNGIGCAKPSNHVLHRYDNRKNLFHVHQWDTLAKPVVTFSFVSRLMMSSMTTSSFHDDDDTDGPTQKTSTNKKKKKKASEGQQKKLFRADRVLSNRSPNWSRSECFDILKKKRVYMEISSSPLADPTSSTSTSSSSPTERRRIQGPSEKIPMDAVLYVDNKTLIGQPPPLLQVFHKPKWMLSVMNDSHGRKNVGELQRDDGIISKSMHPVGRLDYDTSGLLLFSSDGKLTHALLHPTSSVQKEYVAIVVGFVDESRLRQKLADGVETSMGVFPGQLLSSKSIDDPDRVSSIINDIIDNLPPEYDIPKLEEKGYLDFRNATQLSEVRVVVEEGKHRMVRRILANCGHPVISLRRERLGPILLGDLAEGDLRELTPEEAKWAKNVLDTRKSSKQQ